VNTMINKELAKEAFYGSGGFQGLLRNISINGCSLDEAVKYFEENIVTIPVKCEGLAQDVFVSNGYKPTIITDAHKTLKGYHGISRGTIYEKQGKFYAFCGWEADSLGRMKIPAKYIVALEVSQ